MSEPENTKEYLVALKELDREFPAAAALTGFQALLLEINFSDSSNAARGNRHSVQKKSTRLFTQAGRY